MEKAEVIRLINSFHAIKGYFDTTKKYMPQIAKLVYFIEEVIPLFNIIHENLHQSTSMIPTATEKLDKVTSATEMAATEVMDIVDNVINRLNTMNSAIDELDTIAAGPITTEGITQKTSLIRDEVNGCQDDLFMIMNALQFQDITTQQINSINSTIETVQTKLGELLKGFEEEGVDLRKFTKQAFDPNAEFDFQRSAESQKIADEYLKAMGNNIEEIVKETEASDNSKDNVETKQESLSSEISFDENGQPIIDSVINKLKKDNGE